MSERIFHVEPTVNANLEVWSTREIVYAIQDKIPGQYFQQARIILPNEDSITLALQDTDDPLSEIPGQLIGDVTIEKNTRYFTDDSGVRRVRRMISTQGRLYILSLEALAGTACTLQLGNNLVTLLWQEHQGATVMGSLSRDGTFIPGPLVFELGLLDADGIKFVNDQKSNLTTLPSDE